MKSFWKRPKVIIWGIILVFLAIIILQNVEPTSIDIFFWSLPKMPKLVLILISMAVGSLLTMAGVHQAKRSRSTFTPE